MRKRRNVFLSPDEAAFLIFCQIRLGEPATRPESYGILDPDVFKGQSTKIIRGHASKQVLGKSGLEHEDSGPEKKDLGVLSGIYPLADEGQGLRFVLNLINTNKTGSLRLGLAEINKLICVVRI